MATLMLMEQDPTSAFVVFALHGVPAGSVLALSRAGRRGPAGASA